MNLNEYQAAAWNTAQYPDAGKNLYYPALGLTGEAGEIANMIKKIMRDDNGQIREETKEELKGELGDVLWYVACLASELGHTLDDVAQHNVDKLASRKERGVIGGSGNNR